MSEDQKKEMRDQLTKATVARKRLVEVAAWLAHHDEIKGSDPYCSPRLLAELLNKSLEQLDFALDQFESFMKDGCEISEKATVLLAEFRQNDANYLNERIGELHYHAKLHEGELCAKLNRARIGGMIEVLSRMGLEVVCDWDSCTKKATIFTKGDFEILQKVKKEGK